MPENTADLNLEAKLTLLGQILQKLARGNSFALAYSGGLDSRFLAHFSVRAGFSPVLLLVRGPHISFQDNQEARVWATENKLDLVEIQSDPLALPEVRFNDETRCYHCKKQMLSLIRDQAGSTTICDGSNRSDRAVYRPGLAALAEMSVQSPLQMAGLDKPEIRQAARQIGLDRPWQQARPCLLTRFPYRTEITARELAVLAEHEDKIRRIMLTVLPEQKLPPFRLRRIGNGWELHLDRSSAAFLQGSAMMDKICDPDLSFINKIRFLESLSGFFDTDQKGDDNAF